MNNITISIYQKSVKSKLNSMTYSKFSFITNICPASIKLNFSPELNSLCVIMYTNIQNKNHYF